MHEWQHTSNLFILRPVVVCLLLEISLSVAWTHILNSHFNIERFMEMKSCKNSYYIVVIEDVSTKKIVGSGTLAVELKYIHRAALVNVFMSTTMVVLVQSVIFACSCIYMAG